MLKAIHLYINIVSFRGQLPRYLCNTCRCFLQHSSNDAPESSRDEMAALVTLQAVWQAETCLKDMDTGGNARGISRTRKTNIKMTKKVWQSTVTISHVPAFQLCHERHEQKPFFESAFPLPAPTAVPQLCEPILTRRVLANVMESRTLMSAQVHSFL
uniref:Uncharacterized protein n=1 Tax=Rhipicephalus appendiculatus TaxID=34631 RepID=A0A131YDW9_RHIAP